MSLIIPKKELLNKTGKVDYYNWNYQFPIKYIQRYRFQKIIRLLGKKRYPALLEAGIGSGIFLPELSTHCDKLYACDIHSDFQHIHKLCWHYGITNYQLSSQSIEQTDYDDDSFDAIVAVSVLEFVPDLEKAMKEIKRILKPNGVFITICPMQSKFLDMVLSLYTSKKPKEEFGDSRKNIAKALEENFTVVKRGFMIPFIGRFFPVYTHYSLRKFYKPLN